MAVVKQGITIVMTGGGSGGHITPLLAVAHQVKVLAPEARIVYVGQKGDSLSDIPAADGNVDEVFAVRAGKFRRYHGEGWRQLLDVPTLLKNIRDAVYVVVGIGQSYRLLRKLRPQVIFVKGGFVGVPVGLAAALLKIPFITHDSDAIPGLANRIIGRWATVHAVALPKEVYSYPPAKTVTVGVPISHKFTLVDTAQQRAARERLGIPAEHRVVLMTGGGLGAQLLNESLVAIAPQLLEQYPELTVVQLAGRVHNDEISKKYNNILTPEQLARTRVEGFINNLYDYSAAADVVITRAGGTSMAEFATQAKACIVVPNPILAGGHQTKNAQVLADRHAAVLVSETQLRQDAQALLEPLQRLLDDPAAAAELGRRLHELAQPDAARQLGMLLLEEVAKTN